MIIANIRFETQTADFKLKLGIEKSLLDLVQKNSYAKALDEAYKKQNHLIKGFFKVVRGMEHYFQPSEIEKAHNAFVLLVGKRNIETDSKPYTQLVTQINGRIDQYMTIVAKRKSRNTSGETPETGKAE